MEFADIPDKFPIPFANDAGGGYIRPIPEASQIGIVGGAASLTDGFPPLCFTPIGAGGIPPFGQDFNGVLKQITQWSQWQNAGAQVVYDSGFSTDIGGYPKYAMLAVVGVPGSFWVSTVDNNTSDPDSGGANWSLLTALATSRVITAATPQAILSSDTNVFVNQTIAAAITLNLPATPVPQEVTIIDDKGDADVNNITVAGNGNQINNLSAFVLTQPFQSVTLIWRSGATQWRLKGTSL